MNDDLKRHQTARQTAMGIYARATAAELVEALRVLAPGEGIEDLRPSELGLVMARGRIGGTGAPFNAGEVTVTRAAVRLPSGEVGVSYLLGRDKQKARAAAVLDALWQTDKRGDVDAALHPIAVRIREDREIRQRKVAATRVDFFTLARGED
ncbi:phosphonate C-P lyase system protein PhnG [Terrihabitans rhizophilus]|uniref:Phosphonate C-P lyase system protein PhnG n=1 Tax=Terrihabitans rhizophilus TaxID=3092662 RepID=A0ABU4RNR0_9HYPH|nr:phosphonate C-P lyase system protein PhnG [Terrihabitans sp. PJ23]MDX6806481.1 phosphonate C-P lyase system protein PhnG [Terrihabitans sp. PJ23]